MLIRWEDLQPGDKLKFTKEYCQWCNVNLEDIGLLTVKSICFKPNYIRIYFEEIDSYEISYDDGHEAAFNITPQVFEVVELEI